MVENAIVLPGRIPGFKSDDVKVLSSNETKTSVWRVYTNTCKASGEQAVCYSKFADMWQQFHPNVVVSKPMTDLNFCAQQTYLSKKNRTVLEPNKITWTVHSMRGNFIETSVRSWLRLSNA